MVKVAGQNNRSNRNSKLDWSVSVAVDPLFCRMSCYSGVFTGPNFLASILYWKKMNLTKWFRQNRFGNCYARWLCTENWFHGFYALLSMEPFHCLNGLVSKLLFKPPEVQSSKTVRSLSLFKTILANLKFAIRLTISLNWREWNSVAEFWQIPERLISAAFD